MFESTSLTCFTNTILLNAFQTNQPKPGVIIFCAVGVQGVLVRPWSASLVVLREDIVIQHEQARCLFVYT